MRNQWTVKIKNPVTGRSKIFFVFGEMPTWEDVAELIALVIEETAIEDMPSGLNAFGVTVTKRI